MADLNGALQRRVTQLAFLGFRDPVAQIDQFTEVHEHLAVHANDTQYEIYAVVSSHLPWLKLLSSGCVFSLSFLTEHDRSLVDNLRRSAMRFDGAVLDEVPYLPLSASTLFARKVSARKIGDWTLVHAISTGGLSGSLGPAHPLLVSDYKWSKSEI